jgi:catechol 2,3-dioxygenase-like lactoylglutathione lyase family enzyme
VGSPWYCRSVFFVRDVEQALGFYIGTLGFREAWRHADDESVVIVAQVEREGFEVILNARAIGSGQGRVFLSLDSGTSRALAEEWRAGGARVTATHWGMPVLSLVDLDGNEILFTDDELTAPGQETRTPLPRSARARGRRRAACP